MKILLPLPYTPYPVQRGTDRLILNLIDGLSARHDVILATMTLSDEETASLKEIERPHVNVHPMIAPNRRSDFHRIAYKLGNSIKSLSAGLPMDVLYASPGPFLDMISKLAGETSPDLILVSYWHLYKLADMLGEYRTALITHDIDFTIHDERAEHARGFLKKISIKASAGKRTRVEKEAYERFPVLITLTERDGRTLKEIDEWSGKSILTLPLGLDIDEFRSNHTVRDTDRILFLGCLDSDFNRDASLYFAEEIYPLIKEKRPEAGLEIVGHGGDASLKSRLSRSGAILPGWVEDIRPYLQKCTLLVLPLRFGGGIRIRMLEAAAAGIPVVSTPAGIAGIDLKDGEEYIEADGAGAFAESVIALLDDSRLAGAISENVKKWADGNISMSSYPARLDIFLAELERSFPA